jgi:hypothetical protein
MKARTIVLNLSVERDTLSLSVYVPNALLIFELGTRPTNGEGAGGGGEDEALEGQKLSHSNLYYSTFPIYISVFTQSRNDIRRTELVLQLQ